MSLHQERVWTYEDYCKLPDDGNRYEIIDGRLYMSPAPSPYHQRLSHRLLTALEPLQEEGLGTLFYAPVDVIFPGADPVQPDLVYLRADQEHMITEKAIEGVPELLVEVLSPSTAAYDRTVKLNKFAAAGVPHYWMLDRASRTLMLFRLDGTTYRLVSALGPGDRLAPADFPGVALDLDQLFKGIPDA